MFLNIFCGIITAAAGHTKQSVLGVKKLFSSTFCIEAKRIVKIKKCWNLN